MRSALLRAVVEKFGGFVGALIFNTVSKDGYVICKFSVLYGFVPPLLNPKHIIVKYTQYSIFSSVTNCFIPKNLTPTLV